MITINANSGLGNLSVAEAIAKVREGTGSWEWNPYRQSYVGKTREGLNFMVDAQVRLPTLLRLSSGEKSACFTSDKHPDVATLYDTVDPSGFQRAREKFEQWSTKLHERPDENRSFIGQFLKYIFG